MKAWNRREENKDCRKLIEYKRERESSLEIENHRRKLKRIGRRIKKIIGI